MLRQLEVSVLAHVIAWIIVVGIVDALGLAFSGILKIIWLVVKKMYSLFRKQQKKENKQRVSFFGDTEKKLEYEPYGESTAELDEEDEE